MAKQSQPPFWQPLAGAIDEQIVSEVHFVGDSRWSGLSFRAVSVIVFNMTLVQYTIGDSFAERQS
jgi:hypothetical protein